MKVLYVALGYDKQVADMDANRDEDDRPEQDSGIHTCPQRVWDDLDASFKKIDL